MKFASTITVWTVPRSLIDAIWRKVDYRDYIYSTGKRKKILLDKYIDTPFSW